MQAYGHWQQSMCHVGTCDTEQWCWLIQQMVHHLNLEEDRDREWRAQQIPWPGQWRYQPCFQIHQSPTLSVFESLTPSYSCTNFISGPEEALSSRIGSIQTLSSRLYNGVKALRGSQSFFFTDQDWGSMSQYTWPRRVHRMQNKLYLVKGRYHFWDWL